MEDVKNKSAVLTADGQVGTAGNPGYLKSVTVNGNGAAAGQVDFYDGSDTTGTLKYSIRVPANAGDSRSSPPLSIYFANGIYCDVTTITSVSVEYSGA